MKLTGYNQGLLLDLEAAWAAAMPSQIDSRRSVDYLVWLLSESDSAWYQIEGHRSWLYITDIVPGHTATLHALNLDGWDAVDPPLVREELKHIMAEHRLHRLSVIIPAPVGKLHRALKMLGFTKEGRLRGALIFNGRPTDAVAYGLLRHEVEPRDEVAKAAPKRRRRRRRKGNKQWEHKTQPDSRSNQWRLGVSSPQQAAEPSPDSPTKPTNGARSPGSTPHPVSPSTSTSSNSSGVEGLVEALPALVQ